MTCDKEHDSSRLFLSRHAPWLAERGNSRVGEPVLQKRLALRNFPNYVFDWCKLPGEAFRYSCGAGGEYLWTTGSWAE